MSFNEEDEGEEPSATIMDYNGVSYFIYGGNENEKEKVKDSFLDFMTLSDLLSKPNNKHQEYHVEKVMAKKRDEFIEMKKNNTISPSDGIAEKKAFDGIFESILYYMEGSFNIYGTTHLITIEDIVFQLSDMVISVSYPTLTKSFENEDERALHQFTTRELYPNTYDVYHYNSEKIDENDRLNKKKTLIKNAIRRAFIMNTLLKSTVILEIGNVISEYVDLP